MRLIHKKLCDQFPFRKKSFGRFSQGAFSLANPLQVAFCSKFSLRHSLLLFMPLKISFATISQLPIPPWTPPYSPHATSRLLLWLTFVNGFCVLCSRYLLPCASPWNHYQPQHLPRLQIPDPLRQSDCQRAAGCSQRCSRKVFSSYG